MALQALELRTVLFHKVRQRAVCADDALRWPVCARCEQDVCLVVRDHLFSKGWRQCRPQQVLDILLASGNRQAAPDPGSINTGAQFIGNRAGGFHQEPTSRRDLFHHPHQTGGRITRIKYEKNRPRLEDPKQTQHKAGRCGDRKRR